MTLDFIFLPVPDLVHFIVSVCPETFHFSSCEQSMPGLSVSDDLSCPHPFSLLRCGTCRCWDSVHWFGGDSLGVNPLPYLLILLTAGVSTPLLPPTSGQHYDQVCLCVWERGKYRVYVCVREEGSWQFYTTYEFIYCLVLNLWKFQDKKCAFSFLCVSQWRDLQVQKWFIIIIITRNRKCNNTWPGALELLLI